MTIRRATEIETMDIIKQAVDVMKEATMGFLEPTEEIAMGMLSPFLADGGYFLVFAEQNAVAGWIGVCQTSDPFSEEMTGFIYEIYVLPDKRGRGIAEMLCHEAFELLKADGCSKVQLNVFMGNRAQELYRKLGFVNVATLMEKKLDLGSTSTAFDNDQTCQ